MNVLMSADAVGGVWTHALDLARGLAPHGVRVTLATLGPAPTSEQAAAAQRVEGLELRHVGGKLEWMDDPWEDVRRAGEDLLDLAQEVRPDVVHLNGYAHADLPWPAPVVVGAHSCVCGWWRSVHGHPPPAAWDAYAHALDAGLRAADLVVAPTSAMLASLCDHHPMEGVPARVIHNGMPSSARPSMDQKESVVLAVGRVWDEAKGIRTLDQAAEGLEWPVEVAGDPSPPDLDARAGAHARHLRLLGRLDDAQLADAFGRAAVFVHPARYEPFGLTPLEAARRGCALVLSDLPSLKEVWGEAALYAPPGDADALHRALASLTGDASLRRRMAARAFDRSTRYTSEAMADAYLDAYRQLATSNENREEESACAS